MSACSKLEPASPADEAVLDGPLAGLSAAELARFLRGDVAFNDEAFHSGNGLGPVFLATRCASCHAGDGPGHPFTTLTRFGQWDASGNHYLDQGGPQLQDRALSGIQPEQLPSGAPFARFLPPLNTGLGLLDAVSDVDLLAWADEHDADGDGISGRPNWVERRAYSQLRPGAVEQDGLVIGRFGRKASTYDLLQQTATAYNQDIGVVSLFEPIDPWTREEQDPEVTTATIHDVVFYLRTLKAPIRRDANDPNVVAGEQVFHTIGCAKCHRPELTTGPWPIPALAHKTFRPYTDLLLHDMGPGLDDGYTEGTALTSEWRTPALWGLGLFPDSQGGQYFLMHDGRAHSIEEAIGLHGGEGQHARDAFNALGTNDRNTLITFLKSL
ncbi:MAG TPA: di-heme oxidoredictase family protein [Flavobacteriales bacterium]|nr:di-heme oxidoredictase family protein [Flavobacteriales bacterium]